jgi:hypothetical protein
MLFSLFQTPPLKKGAQTFMESFFLCFQTNISDKAFAGMLFSLFQTPPLNKGTKTFMEGYF